MKNDHKIAGGTVVSGIFRGYIKKPENLILEENKDEVKIILDGNKVINDNMQIPANAFEGWAIAMRACALDLGLDRKIMLDIASPLHFNYENTKGQGHLARFLYRAMRFKEQYDWFELSELLLEEACRFREFLESGTFTNNIASCEAGNTSRERDENTIEEALSKGKKLKTILSKTVDIGNNPVYRQLPVGLFKGEVSEENAIFTDRKSAIDLWTYNGTEISIIELKYNRRMIGIITEIFFYSNYIYDLITGNEWFVLNMSPKTKARGYEKLTISGLYESVNGIMLADKEKGFHPLVNDQSLKVLNDSIDKHIRYYMAKYESN